MYKIHINGERQPIFVEDTLGLKIKQIYEDEKTLDTQKILSKEWSGTKGSIRSIVKELGDVSAIENNNKEHKQKEEEWRSYRRREQSKTDETRSKDLSWFNLIRQAFMEDEKIAPEKEIEVIEIQKQFFVDNHYNLLCFPKLFIPVLPKIGYNSMLLSQLIKSAVQKDNEYAKMEQGYNTGSNKQLY